MIQFSNNLLTNFDIINLIYFIATIVENYLFLTILLSVFNVKISTKQKFIYIVSVMTIGKLTSFLISSPFNIIVNYVCMLFLIMSILKLNFIKSLTSLVVTTGVFGLFNVFIQSNYLRILELSADEFLNIPKYRIPYLLILYTALSILILCFNNYRKIKLSLNILDSLDTKTVIILCISLITGFLTLCLQLLVTAYYVNIVPIMISVLNFILLVSFLVLSVYSFTYMIELTATRRDLENLEEYNKSLKILYNKVSGFKHDFDNIFTSLDGYIEDDDMPGLKEYFKELKKDCQIANNLSLLNPNIINNPAIYSLLNNEYFKSTKLGISFNIEIFLNINNLDINTYIFSRILGILIDNAIEASEKSNEKIIKISFLQDNTHEKSVITIKNTYANKDVDLNKIFDKGVSSKSIPSGIGLWQVKKYIRKNNNIDLNTSKSEKYFTQELLISNAKK